MTKKIIIFSIAFIIYISANAQETDATNFSMKLGISISNSLFSNKTIDSKKVSGGDITLLSTGYKKKNVKHTLTFLKIGAIGYSWNEEVTYNYLYFFDQEVTNDYTSYDFSYEYSYYPFKKLNKTRFQPSIGVKTGYVHLVEEGSKDTDDSFLYASPTASLEFYLTNKFGFYLQSEYRFRPLSISMSHLHWGFGIFWNVLL